MLNATHQAPHTTHTQPEETTTEDHVQGEGDYDQQGDYDQNESQTTEQSTLPQRTSK